MTPRYWLYHSRLRMSLSHRLDVSGRDSWRLIWASKWIGCSRTSVGSASSPHYWALWSRSRSWCRSRAWKVSQPARKFVKIHRRLRNSLRFALRRGPSLRSSERLVFGDHGINPYRSQTRGLCSLTCTNRLSQCRDHKYFKVFASPFTWRRKRLRSSTITSFL